MILWGFILGRVVFRAALLFYSPAKINSEKSQFRKIAKVLVFDVRCKRNDWSSFVSTERIAKMLILKMEGFQNTPANNIIIAKC